MGLSADLTIVGNFIDPYLEKTLKLKTVDDPTTGKMTDTERPVITDDGKLPPNDPLMTNSQGRTALLLNGMQGNTSTELYWYEYGRRVQEKFQNNEPMGIRCDTCTALAFFLLRREGCSGSITVIEQDEGKADGHWFLLVGCPQETNIVYPDKFPPGCFVVDLWGVGVKTQRGDTSTFTIGKSAVNPARCVYSCTANKLTKKIYFPGITTPTLPTKDQFVEETTVPGIVGDKSRSRELLALDRALDNFHKRIVGGDAVNTALQAWIGAKSKRQGDEIVSIRKEGIERLRTQINWFTT